MCGPNEASIKDNTTSAQDADQRKKNREALEAKRNYMSDAEYQAALAHLNGSDVAATSPTGTANGFLSHELEFQGFSIKPPPDAPSLTDKLVRARRASQTQSLLTGRGRTESFLGGGRGSSTLGGY